ncbi:MAG TPA: phage holin family protein [Steroidobacteraceae bacterium]|nr:phage holin family protein [Steroidobacteraceae bacterium]
MTAPTQRAFSDVIRDILGNIRDIARSEIQLAKAEVREQFADYRSGLCWAIGAVLCLFFAAGFLLVSCLCGLLYILPLWAAALVLAGALAVAGVLILGSLQWQKHPAR